MKAAPEEHFEFCERPAVDTLRHFLNFENGPSHNFLHSTHPCLPFIGGGGRAVIDRSVNKSNRLSLSSTSVSEIQNIARFEMKDVSIALS